MPLKPMRTPRVSHRLRKAVVQAAAQHKRNAMASTVPSALSVPAGGVQITDRFMMFAFCPSYMNFEQSDIETHARQSETILFRGITEVISITAPHTTIWHRRICFWHHAQLSQAVPLQSSGATTTFFRRWDPLDPTTGDGLFLFRLLFQGTQNIDWTSPLNAAVDKNRISLFSDKLRLWRSTTSGSTAEDQIVPILSARKYYRHFPMRMITYNDEESGAFDVQPPDEGADSQGSPWASNRGGSPGNFYIVDFFSVNGDISDDVLPETQDFPLRCDSTIYWSEK